MIKLFKQFYNFCGKYAKDIKWSLFLGILESFCDATKIIAMYLVIKAILLDQLTTKTIWQVILLMGVGLTLAILLRTKSSMLQTIAGYSTAAEKRTEIADHLKYVPMGFFNKSSLTKITSIATNTCSSFQDVATLLVMMVSQGIFYSLIITILFIRLDIRFALLSGLSLVLFFLCNGILQKKADNISRKKVKADGKLAEKTLEYLQGMVVVKSFNLAHQTKGEMDQAIEINRDTNTKMERTVLPILFLQGVVLKLISVLIMAASIRFYLAGEIELYESITVIIISFALFLKLEAAGGFASLCKVLQLSMNLIEDIQNTPVMDIDGEDLIPSNYNLEMKNVDFAYEKRKVLENVSLKIPEKTTTAIVGPSGGGKTTVTKLLARFWDVDQGSITLGGRNIKDYTLDSLWDNFSVVFQDVYLFHDTVANNIKFGSPEGRREEVEEAAKKACCYDFIMKLPQGFDTMIEDGGSNLSGGEAQRISIARAMMKDAPIIILDEATANVDPENEKELQLAIESLTKDKTVIMIAHRLKTVTHADNIVVMKDGKIEDMGTHKELMTREGTYRNFVQMREHALSWKI